jgi:soluble lytic murein transglycosylase
LLALAEQYARNGQTSIAASMYITIAALAPGDAAVLAGKLHISDGNYRAALDALATARISTGATFTNALLTGIAHERAGQPLSATVWYSQALPGSGLLSQLVNQRLGESLLAAGQYARAVAPLRASVDQSTSPTAQRERREKLALALQSSGNYTAALAQYDAIAAAQPGALVLARISVERASVYRAQGRVDEARRTLRAVMDNYPRTASAFVALDIMLKDGQPVSELQRGIIDYYNDQNVAAQAAFARGVSQTGANVEEIQYWAALNYMDLANWPAAHRNLDLVIALGAKTPRFDDALWARAQAYARAGESASAAVAYRDYAARLPNSARAQAAKQAEAVHLERTGERERAAEAHLAAYRVNPRGEDAADNLLRYATLNYAIGRADRVLSATQEIETGLLARDVRLWQAKAELKLKNNTRAAALLDELALGSDYPGIRARELALETQPFSSPVTRTVIYTAPRADLAEAVMWLALRQSNGAPISPTAVAATYAALGSNLRASAAWQRGVALWNLEIRREANDEFNALASANAGDPLAMLWMSDALRKLGHYRLSIGRADDALRLARGKPFNVRETPRALAQLLYPTYYEDLVTEHSREFKLDPLLVFSLIRQESLFESFAESTAAARGLMQVIPPTGREINQRLQWPPNYTERDLNKPYVSVRFGTSYLARMNELSKGDWYTALAGYNAGIGRALRWQEQAAGDPDMFYQNITIDEPRIYIRRIVENHAIYRALYSR